MLSGVPGPIPSPVRGTSLKMIGQRSDSMHELGAAANLFSGTKLKPLAQADSLFDPYQRNVNKIIDIAN